MKEVENEAPKPATAAKPVEAKPAAKKIDLTDEWKKIHQAVTDEWRMTAAPGCKTMSLCKTQPSARYVRQRTEMTLIRAQALSPVRSSSTGHFGGSVVAP
jgi:hypothetical protein